MDMVCPFCGANLDQAANMAGRELPAPGCVALCAHCAEWTVFDLDEGGSLTLRPPTTLESASFATDMQCLYLRSVILGRILDASLPAEVKVEPREK